MYMHKYFKYVESKTWEFHLKIYIGLLGLIFQASSTKQQSIDLESFLKSDFSLAKAEPLFCFIYRLLGRPQKHKWGEKRKKKGKPFYLEVPFSQHSHIPPAQIQISVTICLLKQAKNHYVLKHSFQSKVSSCLLEIHKHRYDTF